MPLISKSKLIRLQKSLKTDQKIADKLGVSETAVCNWRKVYGIPVHFVRDPLRNGKMVKDYISGISGMKISEKFNLSVSQTYRILRAGMKGKKRKIKGQGVGSWFPPERWKSKKVVRKKK